jgi:hypothetical protein
MTADADHLEAARVLLEAGASVRAYCEGSLPIHIAACIGALPQHRQSAAAAVRLLLSHGAEAFSRYAGGCLEPPFS